MEPGKRQSELQYICIYIYTYCLGLCVLDFGVQAFRKLGVSLCFGLQLAVFKVLGF